MDSVAEQGLRVQMPAWPWLPAGDQKNFERQHFQSLGISGFQMAVVPVFQSLYS